MSKIRTAILSVVLALVVTVAIYVASVPLPVSAAQPGVSCPAPKPTASGLSTEQLWKILNGRYERRVALPY